jgi:hypothetical protein
MERFRREARAASTQDGFYQFTKDAEFSQRSGGGVEENKVSRG